MQPQQSQPLQPIYTSPSPQPTGGGWTNRQKRIMLITGIFAGAAIMLMIIVAIFGGGQSATQVTLTTVNARNSEIIKLIDEFEPVKRI